MKGMLPTLRNYYDKFCKEMDQTEFEDMLETHKSYGAPDYQGRDDWEIIKASRSTLWTHCAMTL